jgi:VIT1/CCC1 family predicted Fe2+/Mn2+ transporter
MRVAMQLSARDVVEAHARDELGLDMHALASPTTAALSGSLSFALGAVAPMLAAALARGAVMRAALCVGATTVGFVAAGATAALLGGANPYIGAGRVLLGGWLELGATYGIGRLVGAATSSPGR